MGQPTKRQRLLRAAQAGEQVARVEIPRTTCPGCQTEQWAAGDGQPRAHLRLARPGDPGFSDEVPTRVACAPSSTPQAVTGFPV